MISIILPYYNPKMLDRLKELEVEKEIIVPEVAYKHYSNNINIKKIKAENFEEFIEKSFKNCNGDEILFLGGETEIEAVKKMISKIKDADIVYLNRKKRSLLAKFFIHLMLPKSRYFSDPLTQIFMIKKSVIEKIDMQPVEKLLIEIIAKGDYKRIREVKHDAEVKFNKDYKNYSKYIFGLAWKQGELFRFIKFGIVGGTSVIINELILWALLPFGVLFAGFMAIEGSILFAFVANDLWTFRDRGSKKPIPFIKRMVKYNMFSLVALIINLAVLLFLVKAFSIHPLLANIAGMACAFIWNFLSNNFIVWSI